jgi:hypothetical protein
LNIQINPWRKFKMSNFMVSSIKKIFCVAGYNPKEFFTLLKLTNSVKINFSAK